MKLETQQSSTDAASRAAKIALLLLFLSSTLNYLDRTILAVIGQAVKADLKLTDTQLGLLSGLAFAFFYVGLGIPVARLAERWNRARIIAIGLVFWSGFTALCGFASNFVQLFLCRIGVGIGEAGLNPPAHSLISDYFGVSKRSGAFGVYMLSVPVGSLIGAIAGGWITYTLGWREAFIILGVPGILLAFIVWFFLREPPRGLSDPNFDPNKKIEHPPVEWREELRAVWHVACKLFGNRTSANMLLGLGVASFATYGMGQFLAPFFIRVFGLNYAETGLVVGLVGGISTGIGTLLGGFATDRAASKNSAWYGLVPAIGMALAVPLYCLAFLQHSWAISAAFLFLPGICAYTCYGPTFAVVQNSVNLNERATANSIVALTMNLIALGFGPVFSGFVIDKMANYYFSKKIYKFIEMSKVLNFNDICLGGSSMNIHDRDVLINMCSESLGSATRFGLIITVFFYGWSAFHYFLASSHFKSKLKSVI